MTDTVMWTVREKALCCKRHTVLNRSFDTDVEPTMHASGLKIHFTVSVFIFVTEISLTMLKVALSISVMNIVIIYPFIPKDGRRIQTKRTERDASIMFIFIE